MFARFFIDRPVLAWVISLVIVLLGGIASVLLPIAEYPDITPPTVQVTARYPGANAQVIADTVAAPIEQQVVGVEGMLYMSSQSNNDGSYTLDVTFALGTDVNIAQVLVQNRVAVAEPTLPDVVKAIGVNVKKRSPDLLLVFALGADEDPDTGRPVYDQLYMSNYATIQLKDALARVEGVGDVVFFGQQDYSMRIWLDPDALQSRDLASGDLVKVLREQNVQVAAGQVGRPPAPSGQDFQYTLSTQGRLIHAEQFDDIIVKSGADGQVTYLKDVARVELGARSEDALLRRNGKPSVGIGIFQLPGSNALDVADGVKTKMKELEVRFPKGLNYQVHYDTTPFIRESVNEVFHALRDAVILVAIVVLLFLQDWKALLLPLIDVAVSLVGTFAVMSLMGFSLNNLTLFGLVLAIGIVVDDAIVVLENIERWLEKGLPVREATIKAMNEITGPILAITLVLSSVLLPSAFLGGITGQFFRQFALTISVSMIISAINAMTMTPARAAWIFANRKHPPRPPLSKGGQRGHGDQGKEALPWWSFAIVGGLASMWLLGPMVESRIAGIAGAASSGLLDWTISAVLFLVGAAAGGVSGWFAIGPVNWVLGRFFHAFNTDGYPMSIGEIQNLYSAGELDIHPEFQRFFRWTPDQKARWIESILIGIPLPSVFVSQQPNGNWDVIDGLQRLSTIFEFMGILKDEENGRIPPLVLTEGTYLKALKGKTWHDPKSPANSLTADQQKYIKRSKLDIKIILRHSDPSAQYEMFQRLNTGGSTLSAQELRNCILISIDKTYYTWLADLSRYDNFVRCISIPERLQKEAYDVELALRFVLLRKQPLNELPASGVALGDYLTERMIDVMTKKALNTTKEEKAFKGTFDLLAAELEADSFRKYESARNRFTGGFSVAAYEVIALGLGFAAERVLKNTTAQKIAELVKTKVWADTSFLTSTGLAAASRLPTTLARGRSIFAK